MHFIGIDVGTGSARAGVFDASGAMKGAAKHDIRVWREPGSIVEQSSADIWQAVCRSVRAASFEYHNRLLGIDSLPSVWK